MAFNLCVRAKLHMCKNQKKTYELLHVPACIRSKEVAQHPNIEEIEILKLQIMQLNAVIEP